MNPAGELVNQARDLSLEREFTASAARTVGLADTGRLIEFAERRANARGPKIANIVRRDFGLEVAEELGDARNYAVWWLQQLAVTPLQEPDLYAAILTEITGTLAHTALAFKHVEEARTLTIDHRNAA